MGVGWRGVRRDRVSQPCTIHMQRSGNRQQSPVLADLAALWRMKRNPHGDLGTMLQGPRGGGLTLGSGRRGIVRACVPGSRWRHGVQCNVGASQCRCFGHSGARAARPRLLSGSLARRSRRASTGRPVRERRRTCETVEEAIAEIGAAHRQQDREAGDEVTRHDVHHVVPAAADGGDGHDPVEGEGGQAQGPEAPERPCRQDRRGGMEARKGDDPEFGPAREIAQRPRPQRVVGRDVRRAVGP